MAVIHRLDPHVADLIAAGEVVERPASVVKELMENSIDAGATTLTVELKSGGMALIRVTDNGCGMAPEDAGTAFLRHATSKLRDAGGLGAIATLGFRGEALAAIAAVSRVELVTRRRGDGEGTRLELEGGTVLRSTPCGCPEGTVMAVRDLFFNTPARLKFMKNDRSEGQAAAGAVTRVALSHPEVSVRFLREGKEEFHTPGDGRTDSCVYTLLGRDCAAAMLPAESNDGEVAVTGFVSTPAGCIGNRNKQFFFCNGRNVKSRLLQAALEQAYRNALLPGRFPACVLYITLPLDKVDVNVHPAKTEVRFVREKQVFDGVYYGALAALSAEETPAPLPVSKSTQRVISSPPPVAHTPAPAPQTPKTHAQPAKGFYQTMTADAFRAKADAGRYTVPREPMKTTFSLSDSVRPAYETSFQTSMHLPEAPVPVPKPVQPVPEPEKDIPAFRVIGEALDTYIVVETGDSLLLIDKHAAHERILFDKLRAAPRYDAPQLLLIPEIVEVGYEDAALLEEHGALLEEYGFDVSPFGEDSVAVRQLPSYLEKSGAKDAILDVCTLLRKGGSPDALRDELLHSMACKAAMKAGKSSEPAQLRAVAEKVVSGEVKYCPHGRPVAMELSKAALDRGFRRT